MKIGFFTMFIYIWFTHGEHHVLKIYTTCVKQGIVNGFYMKDPK